MLEHIFRRPVGLYTPLLSTDSFHCLWLLQIVLLQRKCKAGTGKHILNILRIHEVLMHCTEKHAWNGNQQVFVCCNRLLLQDKEGKVGTTTSTIEDPF